MLVQLHCDSKESCTLFRVWVLYTNGYAVGKPLQAKRSEGSSSQFLRSAW